ncbi:hypothetical protein H4R34_001818 [Dimargaris verticillata]|uniref:N-acetyltransferase domain-containing protein n=1 Tax=Dimargaris verticillata TaxID=2761393 RepID=A0A9W8BAM7_9FUNG|nr:hypothetical protein H4R34_001818 [Dimargaris verticillata]
MTTAITDARTLRGTSTVTARIAVQHAHGAEDLALCLQVRIAVFVDEQGFPLAIENDELDATCHHILAYVPKPSAVTATLALSGSPEPALAPSAATAPVTPAIAPASPPDNASFEQAPASSQATETDRQRPQIKQPVGTLRMFECAPGVGKIGRVAVLPSHRSLGVGRLLMDAAHQVAADELGWHKAVVHSQHDKAGFYAKLGYTSPDPTVYMEEDYPHITMELALTRAKTKTDTAL